MIAAAAEFDYWRTVSGGYEPPLTLADPRLTVPPVRPNLQRYDALLLDADQEEPDGDPDA